MGRIVWDHVLVAHRSASFSVNYSLGPLSSNTIVRFTHLRPGQVASLTSSTLSNSEICVGSSHTWLEDSLDQLERALRVWAGLPKVSGGGGGPVSIPVPLICMSPTDLASSDRRSLQLAAAYNSPSEDPSGDTSDRIGLSRIHSS